MNLIPHDWILPEKIRGRLGEEAGRQRVMLAEGHLLIVLHEPPQADDPERKGRLFWRSPQDEWKSSGLGSGEQALLRHIKEFAVIIDGLEDQVHKADEAGDYFSALKLITPLQRSVRNMNKVLQEARELLPAERELIIARDRAGSLERACELLHADAVNGLNFTTASQSEALSKTTADLASAGHRLNLLAALFLPVTAIATVFGMNLHHGLENINSPLLFWGVLGLGVIIGLFVKARINQPVKSGKKVL